MTEFADTDLTGARFDRVRLTNARFRLVDLSGAQLRGVDLSAASIDGDIDGLSVNGVEIAPLVQAELVRRQPARALVAAREPATAEQFQQAWHELGESWRAINDRVATMPAGSTEVSVDGEWSFSQTLRHLVFATDAWLGAIHGQRTSFHPWGMPFTDMPQYVADPSVLGLDDDARPTYPEVLAVRADRFERVRAFLATVNADQLDSRCLGPLWEGDEQLTVRQCLRVILNEECDHQRFAERDLDVLVSQA